MTNDTEMQASLDRTDAETQQALTRITGKNSWTVAWAWCALSTLMTSEQIFEHWHTWDLRGRLWAVILAVFLLLFPARLIFLTKRRKPIPASWVLLMAYLLLNAAVFAFGVHSHLR